MQYYEQLGFDWDYHYQRWILGRSKVQYEKVNLFSELKKQIKRSTNLYDEYPDHTIHTFIQQIIPMYMELVKNTYDPFVFGTDNARALSDTIADNTGYSKSIIVPILAALETVTQKGLVSAEFYNPRDISASILDNVINTVKKYSPEQAAHEAQKVVSKLITGGVVVTIIYLLGREVLIRPQQAKKLFT